MKHVCVTGILLLAVCTVAICEEPPTAGAEGAGSAAGGPARRAPHIPLCTGMTLVTAINDATGDYESIKTIESADDELVRIRYTAQKVDYGDMLSTEPPQLREYLSRRVVRQEDLRTSRAYLQEFSPEIPEAVPGMTALGISTLVLEELKNAGEAEFGISHWAFPVPPSLDPEDNQSIYRKQMSTRSKVLAPRVPVPVLVNGVLTELPAVHTQGNFYGYVSEFWFLDQPDNPLTLKYRIGMGELQPLSAYDRERCQQDTPLLGYLPQYCTRPDGGDRFMLDLVKINYRCGAGDLAQGAGAEPGSGAGAGSGLGIGPGLDGGAGADGRTGADGGMGADGGTGSDDDAGAGAGSAAGAMIPALDAEKLEQALLDDGRVVIPDIYFTFDSDEIREESAARLREIAEVLGRHPDWKIKVEGHTDSIAADDYNLKLSERRAAAVKHALVAQLGIDAGRLSTEGFGEARPRASNETLSGRAQNRRVELVRVP